MCLTFFISCLLARNVSLKVFLWQLCCRVWRCSVCSLFNPREIAVSKTPVHFYHNSSYRCFFFFFLLKLWRFVWKPRAGVNLPMGDFFALRTAALICLSFYPFDYIYSSASPAPSLSFPSNYSIPLSGDHQANLFQWHFYRMSRLNYDPGARLSQNCNMI